ncbi:MAG: DNA mismatch repair protein MutS [Clostridia bacterium]|nr:DNA mismatch repair protein MutS [Clostridia bacterium]
MMRQYLELKQQHKDSILMYRLGDFYEMFFDDARTVSSELDLTLTGRDCGLDERAPMCGVPFHSVDNYISRLVSRGFSVTICEQNKAENSNEVLGREVTRVITPGTVTDPAMLDEKKNNYIVGICSDEGKVAFCYADVTTGDFFLTDVFKTSDPSLLSHMCRYAPREAYLNKTAGESALIRDYFTKLGHCTVKEGSAESFRLKDCIRRVEQQTGKSIRDLDLPEADLLLKAAGGLLDYLQKTQLCDLSHMKNLRYLTDGDHMELDYSTWRNLEIVETLRSKERQGSLLGVLDKTRTAMGARQLRKFLEKPLLDIPSIMARQDAVRTLYDSHLERTELRELLVNVRDVQRLMTKIVYDTLNPKDMRALCVSFSAFPEIKRILKPMEANLLKKVYADLDPLEDLTSMIESAVVEDPPILIREGKIIRKGYNEKLDELRDLLSNTKQVLANIEAAEREKTGIKNLKIGYNKIIGYFLEVTKLNTHLVPEHYIRKGTLVNAERYITPELKEIESQLATANEQIVQIEYDLYTALKKQLADALDRIRRSADAVALLDALLSLAHVALKNNYNCPFVNEGDVIEIKNGRHPVVEAMLRNDMFVPNDTYLDKKDHRTAIITGPNMAGKSTYMRQVAIIVLMAQIGSFVPASSATIGVCDKIFTRVGASDDLAMGQSTFMVEMTEVAYIVKNATRRSLMIFDEIGRGTSTFDGMSIARAVVEYATQKIGGKSLFATHYHELISLEQEIKGIRNYNIAAKKKGKDILFLRKIVEGGTDDSYGVEVARLAGVPEEIIRRAEVILSDLESESPTCTTPMTKVDDLQISMTSAYADEIIETLKKTDVTLLTPLEAMNELYRLSKQAKDI